MTGGSLAFQEVEQPGVHLALLRQQLGEPPATDRARIAETEGPQQRPERWRLGQLGRHAGRASESHRQVDLRGPRDSASEPLTGVVEVFAQLHLARMSRVGDGMDPVQVGIKRPPSRNPQQREIRLDRRGEAGQDSQLVPLGRGRQARVGLGGNAIHSPHVVKVLAEYEVAVHEPDRLSHLITILCPLARLTCLPCHWGGPGSRWARSVRPLALRSTG